MDITGFARFNPDDFSLVDNPPLDFPNITTGVDVTELSTDEFTLGVNEEIIFTFKLILNEGLPFTTRPINAGYILDGVSFGLLEHVVIDNYRSIIGNLKLSELLLQDPLPLLEKCQACNEDDPNCSSGASKQNIYINGDLEIDEDYCIMGVDNQEVNLSNILLMPGSSIRVTNGATLRLANVKILGCDNMWKGITVEDGKLFCSNVFFNDAQYAIQLKNGTETSILNSTFTDNFVGLYVPHNSGVPQNVTVSAFHNNIFIGTGTMKTPFSGQTPAVKDIPYAGVWATDAAALTLNGGNAGPSMIFTNEFTNLANGIIAKRTNLSVINGIFTDIKKMTFPNNYNPSGIGIFMDGNAHTLVQKGFSGPTFSDATFDDCENAIVSWRCNLDISDNLMENVSIGIISYLAQNRDINISHNYIKAKKTGINLFYNTPLTGLIKDNIIEIKAKGNPDLAYGIQANELLYVPPGQNGGWMIENNRIDQFKATHGIFYRGGAYGSMMNNTLYWLDEQWNPYRGITIINSSGMEISCNTIDGNADFSNPSNPNYKGGRGFTLNSAFNNNIACNQVTESNIGIQAFGMSEMEDMFSGNDMDECFYGLQVGVENNGNAYIGTQNYQGNLWTGAYEPATGALGAKHWSQSTNIVLASQFTVEANDPNTLPTWDAVGQWFKDPPGDSPGTYNCTTESTCPNGIGWHGLVVNPDDELTKRIATDSIPATTNNEVFNWTGSRHLYKRLTAYPQAMTSDTLMQQFYSDRSSSSVGEFFQIDTALQNIYRPTGSLTSSIKTTNNIIRQDLDQIILLDSLLFSRPDHNDSLAYIDQRDSLINDMVIQDTTRSSLVSQLSAQQTTQMAAIESDNAAISGTEIYIVNQRRVNDIFLETMPTTDFTLDSTQIVTLESIAWQCPWAGGDAVFQARGMLSFVRDTVYNDSLLCLNQQFRLAEESIIVDGILVFPNPVSDIVTIEIRNRISGDLNIYNALGQPFYNEIVNEEKTISIQTTSWISGLYYIILQDKNGIKHSASFVISR